MDKLIYIKTDVDYALAQCSILYLKKSVSVTMLYNRFAFLSAKLSCSKHSLQKCAKHQHFALDLVVSWLISWGWKKQHNDGSTNVLLQLLDRVNIFVSNQRHAAWNVGPNNGWCIADFLLAYL